MATNKIVYGNRILIDLTEDTVSADKLLENTTAHNRNGEIINGTIPVKASENLIVDGATITVPAGYYSNSASKSVETVVQATPNISVDNYGLITSSASQNAGYVASGTKSSTKQLSTKGSTTYTPTTSDLTISSGLYLIGDQTIKGDSNLIASNIKKGVSIFGIIGTHEGGTDTSDANATSSDILLGKTAYTKDGKITGIIPTYSGNFEGGSSTGITPTGTINITENGTYDVTNYASANVNVASGDGFTLDDIATTNISGDINLSASSISAYAFCANSKITSLNAPNVTTIGTYAFYNSTGMQNVYLPSCTSISTYCLSGMQINSLSLPECTAIGTNSLNNCKKITQLDLPKVKTIGGSCLNGVLITRLILPECTSIGNSSLSGLTNCTYVDLPKCTSLVNYALRNSPKLQTLILRSETMCTLSNYALNSTKIWNGTGYVYIPRALTTSYQTASNWKTIYGTNANVFRALEDYTIDGTITGELDESKI